MKEASKPFSLLLVDDSKIIPQRIASLIKEQADCYEIFFATSILETYQNLKARNFDFVIADIQLEGKKRFDLIKFIKRLKQAPKLIVLTNQVSQQHKNICMALGADYFVDKSVDFEKLPEIINCDNLIAY